MLETLTPSKKSRVPLDQQAEIVNKLRADPTKSYAFFGPAGTGKTTFGVALYEQALESNPKACLGIYTPHIWRASAKLLMEEFVAYATSKEVDGKTAKEPRVNRRIVTTAVKNGLVPRLFLEEIDKVTYTEFKSNCMFELFDAIYENKGQLVFNSNLTPGEFVKQFGPINGPTIKRRIEETMKVYNFYEK
jgi:DNA replication protein DnaC